MGHPAATLGGSVMTGEASGLLRDPHLGGELHAWQVRYSDLSATWRELAVADAHKNQEQVSRWSRLHHQLTAEQRLLVSRGLWRGGARTLMAALGLEHREVPLTAGLAWLLRPDGHHGLGDALLTRLLTWAGIDEPRDAGALVVTEETRDDTRADLVIYGDTWTVVIEAKVFAGEQSAQLDRLHHLWQDEPAPQFVYLTRGARRPTTNQDSGEAWTNLTWAEVAGMLRDAVVDRPAAAPGALEYLRTLEAFNHD